MISKLKHDTLDMMPQKVVESLIGNQHLNFKEAYRSFTNVKKDKLG